MTATPGGGFSNGGLLTAVTAAEMRAIDRATIDAGIASGLELMERAGAAVVEVLERDHQAALGRGVVIVAGKGNNGGDGFVVARLLRRRRIGAEVVLVGRPGELRGDAAANCERYLRGRGKLLEIDAIGLDGLLSRLARAGLVVDALFGTGLRSPLEPRAVAVIDALNASPGAIVAVDVPSGLDADRGQPLETVVQATTTVTFAAAKVGLLVQPGAELAGELVVADIGIPETIISAASPRHALVSGDYLARALPPRAAESHKGTFGHVLVVGGSPGKGGAASLAARAALRAGAGLVTVAAAASELGVVLGATPEAMTSPIAARRGDPWLAEPIAKALRPLLEGKTAVVVGPGLGTGRGAGRLVEALLGAPLPLLIDADGLNLVAADRHSVERRKGVTILTPHPGEMGRLLGCSTEEVQKNRIAAARDLARATGAVVVLKGSRSLIAAPDGFVAVNPTGNPGMASGGMGDALSGIGGALLAQGLDPFEAAVAAVYWHGFAADRVTARRGEAGLLASDVIEELPPALLDRQRATFGA